MNEMGKNIIINLAAHEWRAKRTTEKTSVRAQSSETNERDKNLVNKMENKSTACNTLA